MWSGLFEVNLSVSPSTVRVWLTVRPNGADHCVALIWQSPFAKTGRNSDVASPASFCASLLHTYQPPF
jgi:hypothetical protein